MRGGEDSSGSDSSEGSNDPLVKSGRPSSARPLSQISSLLDPTHASPPKNLMHKSFSSFAMAMSNYSRYEAESFRLGWGDNGTDHSLGTVVGAVHEARHPRAAPPLHDIEEESDGSASADAAAARGYDVLGLASKAPYVSMGEHDY